MRNIHEIIACFLNYLKNCHTSRRIQVRVSLCHNLMIFCVAFFLPVFDSVETDEWGDKEGYDMPQMAQGWNGTWDVVVVCWFPKWSKWAVSYT